MIQNGLNLVIKEASTQFSHKENLKVVINGMKIKKEAYIIYTNIIT